MPAVDAARARLLNIGPAGARPKEAAFMTGT